MSQRDLKSIVSTVPVLGPITATTDQTSAAIALSPDYQSFLLNVAVGVGGITFDATDKIEFKLTVSSDGSTFAAATQGDVRGVTLGTGGIVKSLVAAHAAASVTSIGIVRGDLTHIKVQADFSGTHGTATPFSVTLDRGHPLLGPVA